MDSGPDFTLAEPVTGWVPLPVAAVDPVTEAASLSLRHKDASAQELLRVALSLYQDRIALVSSFGAESAALLHMVAEIDRATPVIFLDTGRLFTQTLIYRNELARRLGLSDLRIAKPRAQLVEQEDSDRLLAYRDPDMCCWIRKVDPLDTALEPFEAWITGRKRHQATTRSALQPFEEEGGRIKINPLANWRSEDVAAYLKLHDLPPHPLVADGYPSIGCVPCTSRVAAGEDERAGRWRGKGKVECGIHVSPEKSGSGI